jgi:hypothetical protein
VRANRRILLVVVPIIGIGVVIWISLALRPPPEPVYEGRPLSYWLSGYDAGNYNYFHPHGPRAPSFAETEKAITEIGTNAVPILLRMLQQRKSRVADRLWKLARKQHFIALPSRAYETQQFTALSGLRSLGSEGSVATPRLIRIYESNPSSAFLEQSVPDILGQIGPAARQAVPMLLRATGHTNEAVRNDAVYALGRIGAEPELVVPLLVKRLKDTDAQVRTQAARALGGFGGHARSAVPALMELWSKEGRHDSSTAFSGLTTSVSITWQTTSWNGPGNPPDPSATAAEALLKIDPESAAKMGVK